MILKYTNEVRNILGSKAKAEPWLHVAITKEDDKHDNKTVINYIIYIWDTREVIEGSGFWSNNKTALSISEMKELRSMPHAVDNGEPLQIPKRGYFMQDNDIQISQAMGITPKSFKQSKPSNKKFNSKKK
jgi:hypothetical protein